MIQQPKSSNTAAMTAMLMRSKMCAAIRSELYDAEGIEVWTPVMNHYPDIAPVQQYLTQCPISGATACLRIAPTEFLKQLIVEGASNIFEFSTNFRADLADATHLSEFTSLEVMMRGATCSDMQLLTTKLCRIGIAAARGDEKLPLGEYLRLGASAACNLDGPWTAVSLRDLLSERYQFKPDDFFDSVAVQRLYCEVVNKAPLENDAGALDEIVTTLAASFGSPVFIGDYPVYLGGPAQQCADDPRFKERSELFVGSMELANMSSNLTEFCKIHSWYTDTFECKQRSAIRPNKIDAPLMAALRSGLPASAVLGIGIDRLMMIAMKCSDIANVRSLTRRQSCVERRTNYADGDES